MAVYIANDEYFDAIKGIKINRVLSVDLKLSNAAKWQLASTGSTSPGKNRKTIHLWLNPKK